jgi:hypothetical protein
MPFVAARDAPPAAADTPPASAAAAARVLRRAAAACSPREVLSAALEGLALARCSEAGALLAELATTALWNPAPPRPCPCLCPCPLGPSGAALRCAEPRWDAEPRRAPRRRLRERRALAGHVASFISALRRALAALADAPAPSHPTGGAGRDA